MNSQNNKMGIPLGFGMALSQNVEAMSHFSNLSKQEQQKAIDHARNIKSKQEMRSYVQSLLS